jgi:glycosyltransferase involved in cell wall biosynthesis
MWERSLSPSLAICVIVKDEARYIEEWLAFHLLQGVNRILVYENGSSDDTLQILQRSAANAPITIVDWSERPGHFDMVQRAAYLDGATRLKGSSDFVAFIDADEFLHAGYQQSAAEALGNVPPNVSAIAVNQRVFGSSGLIDYDPTLVTARFVRCTEKNYIENKWFKTIARPEQIVEFDSVHSVIIKSGTYAMNDVTELTRDSGHPGQANRIADGPLTLNHYMLRSLDEFRQKQKRAMGRPELKERYEMGYFLGRERSANAAIDDRLAHLSDKILQKVVELRQSERRELKLDDVPQISQKVSIIAYTLQRLKALWVWL